MRREKEPALSAKFVFLMSALLMLIVPFHAVLVPEQVLLVLEFIAVLVLFVVFWSGLYKQGTYSIVGWFLFLSLVAAAIYVMPLPFLNDIALPGRGLYSDVRSWLVGQGIDVGPHYLSIIPYKSVLALLALLPPLAIFFAMVSLSESLVRRLVYLLLIIVSVEAALGLIQYASGNRDFYFGLTGSGSAQGTYINRDHFSALLEMTLPIALGMMLFSIGRSQHSHLSNKGKVFNQTLLFASVALLIFLAAVFARSRAGVFLIMLAVLISSIVFARHIGGGRSVSLTAAFSTVAMGLAVTIGLIPVLNRFVATNPIEDERWRIFEHTIEGLKSFFPIGSGPGTFIDIYPAFQPIEQLNTINRAHNDYLELVFELGAVGIFVIIGFWLLYIFGWFKIAGKAWDRMHFIQVGSGIGIFLLLLHCSVEFILHEPMNTLVFALLAGVFFSKRLVR